MKHWHLLGSSSSGQDRASWWKTSQTLQLPTYLSPLLATRAFLDGSDTHPLCCAEGGGPDRSLSLPGTLVFFHACAHTCTLTVVLEETRCLGPTT